ncbi:MAG: hypothetical protein QOF26_2380 [Baekduia sp.]|jgi:hypothetical protein|nr:hypothetical protein [Baekduia sp.]
MGLLDDAIREHLDLKRRRGADPTEVEREEAEALGPVRRDELRAEAPPAANGGAYEDVDPALDEPGAAYDDVVADYRYESEPVEEPPAPPAYEPPVPSEPPATHEAPYAEDERDSATPPHGDPLLHEQTREFSSLELDEARGQHEDPPADAKRDVVGADDEDGEDEDVLEETPDFLQETPEHDRLWFEQKPPKDFDF